ncbi:MAG: carbohydrate ABC transporter permease [Treponema sp.]|jgi:raffinose/stachyose/melibiose transport system permease protein|nr:carbohydrate ABC transporter permease [Treponema sp.]
MKKHKPALLFIIVLLCGLQLIPLYITIAVSLKPQTDLSSYWKMPAVPYLQNFFTAFSAGNLLSAYRNTFIITACATLAVIILAVMAAYPLARYPSRFNKAVKTFFLSIMMIPALSLLVPIYVLLLRLGGISKYQGIVPVHTAFNLPLAIYMISNFIKTIPQELDEAALIDGCSVYSIFYRIIVPLLKPVIVSVIILTAVPVWNDYQYSVYFLQRPQIRVITLAVASFFQQSGSNPNVAAAAALTGIIPVVVLYIVLQKYFIKGMVDGAIK